MVNKFIDDEDKYIYDAFISYRHVEPDISVAKKLHKLLENYQIPKSVRKQSGIRKINRVFRDQDELPTSSDLSSDIQRALERSKYLIVICSPNTPKSKWCCQEIETFRKHHGNNRILSLLIDGEPDDSFPHSLRFYNETIQNSDGIYENVEKEVEPLAADIRDGNLRNMYKKLKIEKLRILSPMLGVKFDDLRQRHREQFVKNIVAAAAGMSLFFTLFGGFSLYQSKVITVQSEELKKKNEELTLANKQLEDKNTELKEKNDKLDQQIDETIKAKNIATKNKEDAEKAAKKAEENENLAKQNLREAEIQKSFALKNEKIAKQQRDNALINESQYIANLSKQQLEKGDRMVAVMLALEALPKDMSNPDRPYNSLAGAALENAMNSNENGMSILYHDGNVYEASFSPDGRQIITASDDGTARIWDTQGGKELKRLKRPTVVHTAEFSPDGKKIATGSLDGITCIWDAEDGKELIEFTQDASTINKVKFSPNSKKVLINTGTHNAAGSKSPLGIATGAACICDIESGKKVNLEIKSPCVYEARFSPDSKRVVTALDDDTVHIWDAESGNDLITLKGHTGDVVTVEFSPDGKKIVTRSYDNTARIWDAESGKELSKLEGHIECINTVEFSPDGKKIVTGSNDNTARIWDAEGGKELLRLENHTDDVKTAKFSPDGKQIVTGSNDNTVRIWDTESGNELLKFEEHSGCINTAEFSPDGRKIVTGSNDNTAHIWNIKMDKELIRLKGFNDYANKQNYANTSACMTTSEFSQDGKLILTASANGIACIWDAESGKRLSELEGHSGCINTAGFSPDSRQVLTASNDSTARIWDAESGKELLKLEGHTDDVNTAQFSPDSKKIVTASDDDTACIWDAESGKELLKLEGHTDDVNTAEFSPDSKKIVTGSNDGTVRIWDVENGKELSKIEGTGHIHMAKFSPDGKWMITPGSLWNLESGKVLLEEIGGLGADSAEFSPDGKLVVTGSRFSGISHVWNLESGHELLKIDGHDARFSPDGEWIVTAYGTCICIWDAEKGTLLVKLNENKNDVNTVEFSPEGKQIVTSSWDGTGIVYKDFDLNTLIRKANNQLNGRELTQEERNKFFIGE